MKSRKSHHKGFKLTKKLAEVEAIKQWKESRILCSVCEAELTSTDFEVGECTQCHSKIGE